MTFKRFLVPEVERLQRELRSKGSQQCVNFGSTNQDIFLFVCSFDSEAIFQQSLDLKVFRNVLGVSVFPEQCLMHHIFSSHQHFDSGSSFVLLLVRAE